MRGYITAVAAVVGATALRFVLVPLLHDEAPLLIYVLAVFVAGRFGGLGPGILAASLSALVGDYLFIRPRYQLVPAAQEDYVRLIVFACESVAIVLLTEGQRRAYSHSLALTREHGTLLEREVAARTAELNASNEALRGFAYSMSHDLKAPLRAMAGFSKALTEDYAAQLPADGRDYLTRIGAAALRMDRLIDRLLAYNRLSRSDAALALTTVDLEAVTRDVLGTLHTEIERSKAHVEVRHPLPPALGHYETVRQILLNLVDNALKFVRPEQSPRVSISAEQVLESDAQRVKMHVADNGIGVSASEKDRIFQPFQRVSQGRAGSGLGLAIVAQAVERMGGTAGVADRKGGGADFWFMLREPPAGEP